MTGITTCLWFDDQGEEAAAFYTSIFPRSRVLGRTHYGEAGPGPAGSLMTVSFELDGSRFVTLNGGPRFTFSEAISLQVHCETQEEVDRFWSRLAEGGEEGPCGWLKDRYGVSWQVVPDRLLELLEDPDPETVRRVSEALYAMRKIDVAALEEAAAGARA